MGLRKADGFTLFMRSAVIAGAFLLLASFLLAADAERHPLTEAVWLVEEPPSTGDWNDAIDKIRELEAEGPMPTPGTPTAGNILGAALALLWLYTGMSIIMRQRKNLAGWLFAATGSAWIVAAISSALVVWSLHTGNSLPGRDLFAVVYENSFYPLALLPLMFLLFPDGKPPSPRWRWVKWANLGAVAVVVLPATFAPGPLNNFVELGVAYPNPVGVEGIGEVAGPLQAVAVLTILACALSTVVGVTIRFRRSAGEERQQMKWLVSVALMAGGMILLGIAHTVLVDILGLGIFDFILIAFILIIAIGVPASYLNAILRHGLWDLGMVVRKAAVALIIAGIFVVVGLFVGVIVIGQVMWVGFEPAAWIAYFAAGTLLLPLFRWSYRTARRIIFGKRATAYEVLSQFGGRMAETYATDEVLPQLAELLRTATGADAASVWLRLGGSMQEEATSPLGAQRRTLLVSGEETPDLPGENAIEVKHLGESLGIISVRLPANDPLNTQKEELMQDLASQAGLVLRNVQLIEDLRESRRRIVAAGDERAKQLERNIHDGVQQQLVALSVKLRLADTMLDKDATKAHELLAGLQADATGALEDLRDLARGIYPPLLADQGLTVALGAQANKAAIDITVESDGVGRYAPEVEASVYFCCLEALNNIAKYADASHATVALAQHDGLLSFSVRDDGKGFDTSATTHGTGLQGITDRLEAIGGSFEVMSSPGDGTTVSGRVPVG